MLNNATLAEFFNCSIAIQRYRTVLYIQLLQTSTIIGYDLDSFVGYHFARLHAQLPEVRTMLRYYFQSSVCNITFSYVQRPESRATSSYNFQGLIGHGFTTSDIEVSQFVAVSRYLLHTGVRYPVALRDAEISHVGTKLGEFVESEVR